MTVRGIARDFGINYQTLLRYCNKLTDVQITGHHGEPSIEIGYRKNRQIFTPLLEEELVRYNLRTSEIHQGLSPKEARKLAYQLALANNLPMQLEKEIYDIPGILSLAFPRAASNIMAGFKVAGISPFDRDIFQEADFAAAFTKDCPMALSVSPTNQSDTNPEVTIGISSGCVLTPQRIISERPDLVNELPCIVAPPGLPVCASWSLLYQLCFPAHIP